MGTEAALLAVWKNFQSEAAHTHSLGAYMAPLQS